MGVRGLERTPLKVMDRAMKLGALGGYFLAEAVIPRMARRGRGTFIFTGATAGLRGNSGHLAHAAGMFARRGMAQSLAHEFGPQGVHVCHVIAEGMVDAPDTLGKMMPEFFRKAREELLPIDGIIKPDAVADAYYYLHTQPRHSWTAEMDLRPWRDKAWYQD